MGYINEIIVLTATIIIVIKITVVYQISGLGKAV